ncbi:unnamed protein product [Arctogadus glacialis]
MVYTSTHGNTSTGTSTGTSAHIPTGIHMVYTSTHGNTSTETSTHIPTGVHMVYTSTHGAQSGDREVLLTGEGPPGTGPLFGPVEIREVGVDGRVRLVQEGSLTARDRVGVQDFVLLENFNSEAAFIENLRRRFTENLIYTYMGSVLVSVNPYKDLEIYSPQHMERYRGVSYYEISPHIYALSDNTYRVICDLIEEKHKGIISILDEECVRPGEACDLSFLEKLEDTLGGHAHFVTHKLANGKTRRVLGREEFRLLHYAGEVNYTVTGFLDKNNDTLYRSLKEVGPKPPPDPGPDRSWSLRTLDQVLVPQNPGPGPGPLRTLDQVLVRTLDQVLVHSEPWTRSWSTQNPGPGPGPLRTLDQVLVPQNPGPGPGPLRTLDQVLVPQNPGPGPGPLRTLDQVLVRTLDQAATQFKNSLTKLMETLMSKEPSYVRCIKPNDAKQPGRFDEVLVRHQVKYLGLMENLRVRRAGFAYRRHFEAFLQRYKPLCPETWPVWQGELAEGVSTLVQYLGYKPEEYKMGRSKIFIRLPKTLFTTEDELEAKKPDIALILQTSWRGYRERSKYKRIRNAVIVIQAAWRGMKARRRARRRRDAADLIRRLIKGFVHRHEEYGPDNDYFLDHVCCSFLKTLRRNLARSVLDKSWPTPPASLTQASEELRRLNMRNMVRKFCLGILPEWRKQMDQKVVASELFRGQKDSYPPSVAALFLGTRLESEQINLKVVQTLGSEKVQYGVSVIKYDRRGFKPRPRQLLLTGSAIVLVEKTKIKQRIDYDALRGISVSRLSDGILVLHVLCEDNKQKADLVLLCDHVIEVVTKVAMMANKVDQVNVSQGSIRFSAARSKEGVVDFTRGPELKVAKGKHGHLLVTARQV